VSAFAACTKEFEGIMNDVWGMVSVIVAAATFLPLLLSKPAQKIILKLVRSIGVVVFPAKARCEVLTWNSIRDGPLHLCQPTYCPHMALGRHSRETKCWKFIEDSSAVNY
jgi:hypothetical protein